MRRHRSPLPAPLGPAGRELAVRALAQPLLDADPAAGVRDRGRDARDGLPARRRARASADRDERGRRAAPTARPPGGQARRALRADLPRPRQSTAAAATASTCSSTSSGCAQAVGDDTRDPLPQAPLRRRPGARDRRTASCATSRAIPDGTELLLAADVLVTDYSSMMVDFANTGRPMLFFTYDLDAYRDEIRGFYLDFVGTVPGPLLRHHRRARRGAARPRRRPGATTPSATRAFRRDVLRARRRPRGRARVDRLFAP